MTKIVYCSCCGQELDLETDEIWECPDCGNLICDRCVADGGDCIDCLEKRKLNDIFKF